MPDGGEMMGWMADHPEVIAVLVLALGWLLARLARHSIDKAAPWINRQAARLGGDGGALISPAFSRALQMVAFWAILLIAVLAALYIVWGKGLSGWLSQSLSVVPRLLAALAILAVGHLLGLLARGVLSRYASSPDRQTLPGIAYAVIIGTAAITALEQVGLDVSFLTHILLIIVSVFLAGLALAFALGARTLVANLAAQGEIQRYQAGDHLVVDGVEGTVVEIRRTGLVLSTAEGLATVPAHKFATLTVIEKRAEAEEDG